MLQVFEILDICAELFGPEWGKPTWQAFNQARSTMPFLLLPACQTWRRLPAVYTNHSPLPLCSLIIHISKWCATVLSVQHMCFPYVPCSVSMCQCMQAHMQVLRAHMRANHTQHQPATFPPRTSPSAATAPGILMQHSPPSSRAGSMQHRRLVSAAAAAPNSVEDYMCMHGRHLSLAVSVANTINAHARPTSTQEGAETPIAASDDDTIEMGGVRGQGGEGCSRRLRSSSELRAAVATGSVAAADAAAGAAPRKHAEEGQGPPSSPPSRLYRRMATRAVAQRVAEREAMRAQDSDVGGGVPYHPLAERSPPPSAFDSHPAKARGTASAAVAPSLLELRGCHGPGWMLSGWQECDWLPPCRSAGWRCAT